MSTPTITPYRSGQRPGRDDFAHLLRAEWTKFRSVRGWVIAMIGAVLLTALAVVALASAANGKQNPAANPGGPFGPDGEAVTDSFYFVHQSLDGNGSITARVTSFTSSVLPGQVPPGGDAPPGAPPVGQSRDHHQGEHHAGFGLRRRHGHPRARRPHAVELHQRHGRAAGRGI